MPSEPGHVHSSVSKISRYYSSGTAAMAAIIIAVLFAPALARTKPRPQLAAADLPAIEIKIGHGVFLLSSAVMLTLLEEI